MLNVWTGDDATYIDGCNKSSTPVISVKKYVPYAYYLQTPVYGTVASSGVLCKTLPLIGWGGGEGEKEHTVSKYAKMAYTAVGNYYYNSQMKP